jgi:hypothetical protein
MLVKLYEDEATEVPIVGGGVMNVQCEAVRNSSVDDFRKRLEKRAKSSTASQDKTTSQGDKDFVSRKPLVPP